MRADVKMIRDGVYYIGRRMVTSTLLHVYD